LDDAACLQLLSRLGVQTARRNAEHRCCQQQSLSHPHATSLVREVPSPFIGAKRRVRKGARGFCELYRLGSQSDRSGKMLQAKIARSYAG
jgi:hypothetical protein